jgi:hypothetical protein
VRARHGLARELRRGARSDPRTRSDEGEGVRVDQQMAGRPPPRHGWRRPWGVRPALWPSPAPSSSAPVQRGLASGQAHGRLHGPDLGTPHATKVPVDGVRKSTLAAGVEAQRRRRDWSACRGVDERDSRSCARDDCYPERREIVVEELECVRASSPYGCACVSPSTGDVWKTIGV